MNRTTEKHEHVLYWTLQGRLTPENRLQYILGILTTHPPRKPLENISSQLRIELLDKNERLLVRQKVPVAYYYPDRPQTTKNIAIRAKVPFHKDTKLIRFWNGDVLVKEWKRPDRAPVIDKLKVKLVQGHIHLTWHAYHPEEREMQFVVRFSNDGGDTFNRLSQRLDKPNYEVAENQLPGGKGWIFQIAVTDGVNTTTADAEPMDLPETPPLIEISNPPNDHKVSVGTRLMFHAELIAFQGKDVNVSSALWTSDRDGNLSDQFIFETDQLSRGTHIITFTVEDSQNRKFSSSISVHVTLSKESDHVLLD